eukprot:scaffold2331_cov126-Cylindrotheca_fusiformis.AAC.6
MSRTCRSDTNRCNVQCMWPIIQASIQSNAGLSLAWFPKEEGQRHILRMAARLMWFLDPPTN